MTTTMTMTTEAAAAPSAVAAPATLPQVRPAPPAADL
jgi:hypothetical protein